MKVHITATPDVDSQLIGDVINVLNVVKGEIEFQELKPYPFNILRLAVPQLSDPTSISPLSFEELFRICDVYRELNKIPLEEFVVVITEIENVDEWFSAFNDKNIFVKAIGWEDLTNKDRKIAVAHQIVENLFQSLIKIDIPNYMTEPNVHHVPIGCINDMCEYEMQVIFKLRTGYICDSCFNRAVQYGVSDKVLLHIYRLIQEIREKYMNYDALIKGILKPYYVDIYPNHIEIGDKRIRLGELPETLFRFFLKHEEGVSSLYEDEKNYDDELLEIYSSIKKGGDRQRFKKTIDLLCHYDYDKSTLSKYKNDLSNKLREQIGEDLYKHYIIKDSHTQNGEKIMKIDIPKMYVRWRN